MDDLEFRPILQNFFLLPNRWLRFWSDKLDCLTLAITSTLLFPHFWRDLNPQFKIMSWVFYHWARPPKCSNRHRQTDWASLKMLGRVKRSSLISWLQLLSNSKYRLLLFLFFKLTIKKQNQYFHFSSMFL